VVVSSSESALRPARRCPPASYGCVAAQLRPHYTERDLAELLCCSSPSMEDDVSITRDGRRLDPAGAVIEFFDELRRERERTNDAK